jgi:hypothetical protein
VLRLAPPLRSLGHVRAQVALQSLEVKHAPVRTFVLFAHGVVLRHRPASAGQQRLCPLLKRLRKGLKGGHDVIYEVLRKLKMLLPFCQEGAPQHIEGLTHRRLLPLAR